MLLMCCHVCRLVVSYEQINDNADDDDDDDLPPPLPSRFPLF